MNAIKEKDQNNRGFNKAKLLPAYCTVVKTGPRLIKVNQGHGQVK